MSVHVGCVACCLGWPSEGDASHVRGALMRLCAQPSIAGLRALMLEVDVVGDGSCWVYVLLLWHGLAPHALTPLGRPRRTWRVGVAERTEELRVGMPDRVADLMLRAALAKWMRDQDWARRLFCVQVGPNDFRAGTEAENVAAVRERELRLPCYGSSGLRMGCFGGDIEFVAAADLLGMAIMSVPPAQLDAGPRERPTVAFPGVARDGRGKSVTVSVRDTLRMCLSKRWPLRVGLSEGGGWCARHWHALVPTDDRGRVLPRALPAAETGRSGDTVMGSMLPAVLREREAAVRAYDAAGGYGAGAHGQ